MTKRPNKISYVSILVILFGLIAIFLIVRNSLLLKNIVELEATCYSYKSNEKGYVVSYYYIHKGQNVNRSKRKINHKFYFVAEGGCQYCGCGQPPTQCCH